MDDVIALSELNQKRARQIIEETGIVDIWHSIGAEINLVGSLKTGLLMKKRDIDFHIYSDPLKIEDSFSAISRLGKNSRIKKIMYGNLLDTGEECLEWHAWYLDSDENEWQIDMIHMPKGSPYAGYFERVADRILASLDDEKKYAILKIKNDIPDEKSVMGIEIYQAVIRDGVRNYADFMQWRKANPNNGIIEWMP